MSGFLKYICLFNQKDRYSPFWSVNNFHFRRDGKHDEICALHNSESSLSHIGSMETLIDAPSDDRFMIEDNPEVMLDVLTMQSLRDRYNEKDFLEVHLTAPYVNEQDFDHYVREFVIDDAISECFAQSEEATHTFSFPFQKNYTSTVKQNRLKKKLLHKSPQEEMILSDDESRSSDSKKSKLIGNIFNRKQKGKENIKPIKDSKENGDITGAIIDACEHITKTYKPPTNSGKDVSVLNDKSPKKEQIKSQGTAQIDSIKSVDVGRRTSFGGRARESSNTRRLPPVPTDASRSDSSLSRRKHSSASSSGNSRRIPKKSEALIDELMMKSDNDLAASLYDLPYDALRKTRDRYGNTVLHRCVQDNKITSTKTLSTKYPQMCSELNNDRLSALEYAVKLGNCDCMLILLEKSRSDGVLESLTVPRLLNMAAEYNQPQCLETLLDLLPKGDNYPLDLPPDSLGNTAAHEAASKGHLNCFKILLENGYDVWSRNSEKLCPIQLAIHNHHTECYGYMLLFESSRCLAREASHHFNNVTRLKNDKLANYDAFVQIESQLSRYQEQLNEAMRSTLESQENILVTLDCIHDQLSAAIGSMEDGSELSFHLESIKGEAERLQDLFDFSVIANANSMLSKLLTDFREVLKDADGKVNNEVEVENKPYIDFRLALKEMEKKCEEDKGENLPQNVKEHIHKFIESHKKLDMAVVDKETTSNTSSTSNSNKTFTITKKSLKLPPVLSESAKINSTTAKRGNSVKNMPHSQSSLIEKQTKKSENSLPRSVPNEDENKNRILESQQNKQVEDGDRNEDVGESHQHENLNPPSPEAHQLENGSFSESLYTTTLTSNYTNGDQFSDWTSKSDTLCRDSCASGSDWWQENRDYYEEEDDLDDGHNRVRLNVADEDLSDDMLRQHRLNQHLKSVAKINSHHNDVIETVVTASGRQLGKSNPSKIPKAAPRPSISKDNPKQKYEKHDSKRMSSIFSKIRNKNKVKLFSVDDVSPSREISQSEFMESYDRSQGGASNDLKWDEVSLTDAEEYRTNEKPWYEMSEDEESLLQGWKSDEEDTQSRDLGHL